MEGLELQGAYKGYRLPPVKAAAALQPDVHPFRSNSAQNKSGQRDQIFYGLPPLPFKQVGAHEHNVPRLGVGKDPAPVAVGIGILKPAGKDKKKGSPETIRDLPVKAGFLRHKAFSP